MGKKRLKNANSQKSKSENENKINNDTNNNEEEKDEEEIIEIKIELKTLLDIINSNNSSEIYNLTSFLSTYNYDILSQEQEKRDKEIFALTSNDFLLPYLNLYLNNKLDENKKIIKYNIISSIINIFSSFSENSKYEINFKYLYNKILSEIFYQTFSSYPKENNINIKDNITNKIITLIFELFQLFIDIIKNDDKINSVKGLINYDIIINALINEFIFNNNIENDIKNKAEFLLFSLSSNFYLEINEKNNSKLLINNILSNSNKTNIDSLLYFICFYLLVCQKDINSLKIIFQKINDLTKDIEIFNKDIIDLFQFLSQTFDLEGKKYIKDNNINIDNEINSNISDDEIQKKLETFLLNCKTLYGLIKIYSDIIENVNDSINGGITYPDDIFLNNMTLSINQLFNNSNKSLNMCYNDAFISSLIQLMNNIEQNNLESYFMNTNDSIMRIKEYLNEMLLLILGIINNVILKINPKFKNNDIKILLDIIFIKLNNYKSNDDEEISLIILLLRNMFEKKIINIDNIIEKNKNEELNSLDYKLLFCIFNFFINDENIKINIIDIIAFIYSTEITNDNSWYDIIKELNNLLITLLYNEKNIEVVSHVINAFMDIYQWDDVTLNQILKNSNVINIMSNGIKAFKKKMENSRKANDITEDTYEYISETLTNMKRFIKYKENI